MSLSDQLWGPTSAQVTVLQARGLKIKGKNGTNDAYAVMQVGKEKYQTSVAEKSIAPVWKEEASFELPCAQQGATERGTLHVHVLHRALVGPDKLLGQAVINLLQLSEDKSRDKTQWFKLLDKAGKPDKDRGEVLVDIQFLRNNMTASMFDISAAGKSRSRLGKFKDKVRGKKKDSLSETASSVVPSLSQVLTDSEDEGNSDTEGAAGKDEKKKKKSNKVKSLFSHKSNLQKSLSQSMSVLPGKNSSLSGSMSSGLNVEASEGKKKFKFLSHKRTGSSDKKDQKLGAEPSNLCINGSHVYCEEPTTRTSRTSSNFSLTSSGVGSMEDVPDSTPPSVGSAFSVRHSSPWTEEEEEEETIEERTQEVDAEMFRRQELEKLAEAESRSEEEAQRRAEQEKKREEDRRQREEEEEKLRMEEEQRRREEEMVRIDEEQKRKEEEMVRIEEQRRREEEKLRMEEEQRRREEEKLRMEEEQRRREEEMVRIEEEQKRKEEKMVRIEEQRRREEEKLRMEEEQRRREEEKLRMEEEQRRREEEMVRTEEEQRRREEEKLRREEEQRRKEEEMVRIEEQRRREEEKLRMEEEQRIRQEEMLRIEEQRRREEEMMRIEEEQQRRREEEMMRIEEQRRQEEEIKTERVRFQKEEEKQTAEKCRVEMEEKQREENERKMAEEERQIEEKELQRRKEEEDWERDRFRKEEQRMKLEEERHQKEEEERRQEERIAMEIMLQEEREEEMRKLEEEKARKEKLLEEERKEKDKQERIRKEEEEFRMEQERAAEEQRVEEERKLEEERRLKEKEKEREEKRKEEERVRKKREEQKRLEEEEKKQQEIKEQERIRQEEEKMRAEKERAEELRRKREEEEEYERLLEEKRKLEKEKRRLQMEQEKKQRQDEKEELERLAEEKRRQEDKQKRRIEKEDRVKVEENRRTQKTQGVPVNPFDESEENNPFEDEVPQSTAQVTSARQRCKLPSERSTCFYGEKDVSTVQREKRHAPKPPRMSSSERQQVAQHEAQVNKEIKTASVLPQRSVQKISPVSAPRAHINNSKQLESIPCTARPSSGRQPAPQRPDSVDQEGLSTKGHISYTPVPKSKHVPAVGLNPFEDEDDDVDELRDQQTTTSTPGSVICPPPVPQSDDKDAASQMKIKSSKTAHAPAPPAKKAPTSRNNSTHDTEVTISDKNVDNSSAPVQEIVHKESPCVQEEAPKKDAPPVPSRRLQPVKPLNALDHQPVSAVEAKRNNKSTGEMFSGQEKTKVTGPYALLTQEELISLVLKQERQLMDKNKKISELEQYIDNMLVRVIEEAPSILMTLK